LTSAAAQAPLQIPLKPDRLRFWSAILLLPIALFAVLISALPWWLQASLAMLIAASAWWQHRHAQNAQRWHALVYRHNELWSLLDHQGERCLLQLQPQFLLSPWLIIVHGVVADAGRGRVVHLWFWKHQHEADVFRRLAVCLKYHSSDPANVHSP